MRNYQPQPATSPQHPANHAHSSSALVMSTKYILGTNQTPTRSANMYVYDAENLVYYVNNCFIKYNIQSKEYGIYEEAAIAKARDAQTAQTDADENNQTSIGQPAIYNPYQRAQQTTDPIKQPTSSHPCPIHPPKLRPSHTQLITTKYFQIGINTCLMAIKTVQDICYLSVFWTEINTPVMYRIGDTKRQLYTNLSFHGGKGYVYLLGKMLKMDQISNQDKLHSKGKNQDLYQKLQYLKIIQIKTPQSLGLNSHTWKSQQSPSSAPIQIHPKMKHVLTCQIKKTGGGIHQLDDLIIGDHCTQLYLYGLDYFRLWNIMFNEKTIKESNYRNIQRNIKKQKICGTFWVPQALLNSHNIGAYDKTSMQKLKNQKSKRPRTSIPATIPIHHSSSTKPYLIILTTQQILFIHNNQLIQIQPIPDESPYKQVHRQAAQIVLEKSLNQIYKTRFRVGDLETEQDQQSEEPGDQNLGLGNQKITAASSCWVQIVKEKDYIEQIKQNNLLNTINNQPEQSISSRFNQKQKFAQRKQVKFLASFECGKVFIYKILPDLTVKIQHHINTLSQFDQPHQSLNSQNDRNPQNSYNFIIKNISTSTDGKLLLLTNTNLQNFLSYRKSDPQNSQLDPLYSLGHGHTSPIISISAPKIIHSLSTISQDGNLKIWSKADKQRCLLIDAKFKQNPLQAIMHPSGFVIMVNFGLQIKVFGIISGEIEEIVSVKTNDYCSEIYFNPLNNYLFSNQKNIIKVYDPFTLHVFSKIQPEDLRLEYKKIQISTNGQYLIYQCCNQKLFRQAISSLVSPQAQASYQQTYQNQNLNQNLGKTNQPIFCHRQSEQYTCFYFNFGSVKNANSEEQNTIDKGNLFIGFTKTKFMVLYGSYAQNLIAEFPVIDNVYVTDFCIAKSQSNSSSQASQRNQFLFVSTNRGSVRVYKWPIVQQELVLNVTKNRSRDNKQIAYYLPPAYLHQFQVWKDSSPITCLFLGEASGLGQDQIVAGGQEGLIAFVGWGINKRQFFQNMPAGFGTLVDRYSQRMKMLTQMNSLKLMKLSQLQKISKLIEKTQKDIEKIKHENKTEEQNKTRQFKLQNQEQISNIEKRKKAYQQEFIQKLMQHEKQKKALLNELSGKKRQHKHVIQALGRQYSAMVKEEKWKIQTIKQSILLEKAGYKQKIEKLIQQHKQNIREIKDKNLREIKKLQNQFEQIVCTKYNKQLQIGQLKQLDLEQQPNSLHPLIQSIQTHANEIEVKQRQLQNLVALVEKSKKNDQQTQILFEHNLQIYNQHRYENLVLHSELLKIQNQLYERKEILAKKDQIIGIAYQEKEINQIYKQYVSGAVGALQDSKEKTYCQYIKKQQGLRLLFEQLTLQIKKSEQKKLRYGQLKQSIKILSHQIQAKKQNIKLSVQKLKDLKKFLLVQGVSQDSQHKRFYHEQQKLLTTIRWLEKRFRMNCLNQKKLTNLKKSGVNQIINQNKNLLQQCNQLRQEGIIYQNQIEHLSKKLSQANRIIELQKKLRSQNSNIAKQTQKLVEIRKMFVDQIERVGANGGIGSQGYSHQLKANNDLKGEQEKQYELEHL